MGQVLIRNLDDAIIAAYRQAANSNGRSLEAELREGLARARPMAAKDPEELGRLSRELRAMTPPEGPDTTDSTLLIRWDRDTDHGRGLDDGWEQDERGHARR
jgi:plasmid stability protein